MPGFDGTGPLGLGPLTGGARGFCTGYRYPLYPGNLWSMYSYPFPPWLTSGFAPPIVPPYYRPRLGLGLGLGRWRGRRFGYW